MSYGTPYQATPIKPVRVGRVTMTKSTNTAEASKPAKKYAKTRGEHYKDIVIAILVTAVVAFVVGVHYANNQHAETAKAVEAATAQTTAVKK